MFVSLQQVNNIKRNSERKDYYALDRNLFIRKPIENEELVKKINKMIKKE